MHHLTRQFGLALALFLIWFAAASTAQLWLRTETGRIRTEAVATKQAQFEHAMGILQRTYGPGDETRQRDLEALLGVTITRPHGSDVPAPIPAGRLGFEHPGAENTNAPLLVTFPVPGDSRLALLHHRTLVTITLLALLFVLGMIFAALLRRSLDQSRDEPAMPAARAEMSTLAHLARLSNERTAALAQESGARRRAEEHLEMSRTLLDQSVEDRVRLGRDLHDNLCQTLYAVALNLEGVRKRLRQNPTEAEQNLTTCMQELRGTNRDVRAWIAGLSPDAVRRQTFIDTLQATLTSFGTLVGVQLESRIDPGAAELMTPIQATEALRIVREAVSNAVFHGAARAIVVHLQREGQEVVLAIHDNGGGFDPQTTTSQGFGLKNMRARAGTAGGSLRIESTPGHGARVALSLPILAT